MAMLITGGHLDPAARRAPPWSLFGWMASSPRRTGWALPQAAGRHGLGQWDHASLRAYLSAGYTSNGPPPCCSFIRTLCGTGSRASRRQPGASPSAV